MNNFKEEIVHKEPFNVVGSPEEIYLTYFDIGDKRKELKFVQIDSKQTVSLCNYLLGLIEKTIKTNKAKKKAVYKEKFYQGNKLLEQKRKSLIDEFNGFWVYNEKNPPIKLELKEAKENEKEEIEHLQIL